MYGGIIPPQTYNALFTMHATIMIFFVVMPIMVGCFGNFLIPLMIGARDMAFPKLNMLSFWVGAVSGVVMLASFFVPGGPAASAGRLMRRSRPERNTRVSIGGKISGSSASDPRCFVSDGLDQLHHDDR